MNKDDNNNVGAGAKGTDQRTEQDPVREDGYPVDGQLRGTGISVIGKPVKDGDGGGGCFPLPTGTRARKLVLPAMGLGFRMTWCPTHPNRIYHPKVRHQTRLRSPQGR